MTMRRAVAGLAVIIASATACSDATAPREPATPDFRTDSASYTLRAGSIAYQGIISVSYTNHTGAAVSFANCMGTTDVELEKLVSGAWVSVWSPVMPLCMSLPITVAPNATWRTTVYVSGAYPEVNADPKFSVTDVPGTYRAVWTQATVGNTGAGDPLPEVHRVSNAFMLSVEPRPLP